eukprot:300061-Pelagomonas_calceolata.AAC.1
MNLKVSEEHAVWPYMAAQQRIKEFVHLCSLCEEYCRELASMRERMLVSNSETQCQVLKAELDLADRGESCWFAHVSKSSSGMHNEEVFKQKLLSASKIPVQNFLGDLRYRQQKVWRKVGALSPPRGEQESSDLPSM